MFYRLFIINDQLKDFSQDLGQRIALNLINQTCLSNSYCRVDMPNFKRCYY